MANPVVVTHTDSDGLNKRVDVRGGYISRGFSLASLPWSYLRVAMRGGWGLPRSTSPNLGSVKHAVGICSGYNSPPGVATPTHAYGAFSQAGGIWDVEPWTSNAGGYAFSGECFHGKIVNGTFSYNTSITASMQFQNTGFDDGTNNDASCWILDIDKSQGTGAQWGMRIMTTSGSGTRNINKTTFDVQKYVAAASFPSHVWTGWNNWTFPDEAGDGTFDSAFFFWGSGVTAWQIYDFDVIRLV